MERADERREDVLKRRAQRLARKGEYRKAALALRERVTLTGDAPSWVALGDMLRRARRTPEALNALRQGMYLHRQAGALGRARTVARMIVALDPWDAQAARMSSLERAG
jgi:tetratricopeptide (TPR) repeat protein